MAIDWQNTSSFDFFDTSIEWHSPWETDFFSVLLTPSEYLLDAPDWAEDVNLRKTWKTNVRDSIVGEETRSALYTFSRTTLEFSLSSMTSLESQRLTRKIYKNLHKVWAVPYWMDVTTLSTDAASTEYTVTLTDISYATLKVGSQCAIFNDPDTFEIGTIKIISGNTITLVMPLGLDWSAGSTFVPLLKGMLTPSQSLQYVTDSSNVLSFKIKEVVDPNITQIAGSSAYSTYEGHDLFTLSPDWSGEREFSYAHPYTQMQFIGVGYHDSSLLETKIKITDRYLFATRSELADFLAFFDYKKGCWGNFWLSSNNTDINIVAPFDATDTDLIISPIDWDIYWTGNVSTGKYINIQFADGTSIQREIVSVPKLNNVITLDSAIGRTATSAEVQYVKVSFLYMVRFALDEIAIKFETDTVASTEISFELLPNMEISA